MNKSENPLNNFRHKHFKLAYSNLLNVDIAFVVDCTSSMGLYIRKVRQNIREIVSDIKENHNGEIRFAFVGYRDHNDGPNRIETLYFTKDVEVFETFVGKIKARSTGNADFPEDVFGGLEETIKLNWSYPNRVIFHIADAPQHGTRFHDFSRRKDNYFDIDEPRGVCIENLLSNLKTKNLNYYFGRITKHTDKMIREFQDVGGKEIVHMVDVKDPNNMFNEVVNAINRTISAKNCKIIKTKQIHSRMIHPDLLL